MKGLIKEFFLYFVVSSFSGYCHDFLVGKGRRNILLVGFCRAVSYVQELICFALVCE